MKKIISSLWFILAAGALIFAAIYGLITLTGLAGLILPTLVIISLAVALFLLFMLRHHITAAARFLFVLWTAILSGAMVGVLFLELATLSGATYFPLFLAIVIGSLIMLLMTILLQKHPIGSLMTALVLLLLTFALLLTMEAKQVRMIKETKATWKAKGIPATLTQVVPRHSTKTQCKAFLDAVGFIKQDEEMNDYFQDLLLPLNKATWKALAKGEDLRVSLAGHHVERDERWAKLTSGNARVLAALPTCPYVQLIEPATYTKSILAAPIPNLLHQVYWTKGMMAQAVTLANKGEFSMARQLAFGVDEAAKKFQIPGRPLITNLIDVYMEKTAWTTIVAIQALEGKPMPLEDRSRFEKMGKPDPVWAASFFDLEGYRTLTYYDNCDFESLKALTDTDLPILRWKPFARAFLYDQTRRETKAATAYLTWIHSVPDFAAGRFRWHEARKALQLESTGPMTPYVLHAYMRLVALAARARLADGVDRVLAHYAAHHTLPESVDQMKTPWPLDPFTNQPIVYKRVGKRDFIVSSVGADEKQGDPTDLYITGIMRIKDPRDLGFHIRF